MNESNKELVRESVTQEEDENMQPPPNDAKLLPASCLTKERKIKVFLLHSPQHTRTLNEAMEYIHQDRDLLLQELLEYCGFGAQVCPRFLSIVSPKRATRKHLEQFHESYYLDALEYSERSECDDYDQPSVPHVALLESLGLVDCCPIPDSTRAREALWKYCLSVAGATLHAASLLQTNSSNIAIHWGGGRHHAHSNRASGFCYINDVVLGIQSLFKVMGRVLYLDIDVHHADGVQEAFYDADTVMTVSFHRHARGFFPSDLGGPNEKGRHGTPGVGYNLNVCLPKSCRDADFIPLYQYALDGLLKTYKPQVVVLCVGADGVRGDPVVGSNEGWNLTPEGLAECVRYTSQLAVGQHDLKLLVVGGGGYDPATTARTFLLCTAAACEAARPGLLQQLPRDVPRHEYFERYGPDFRLYRTNDDTVDDGGDEDGDESMVERNDDIVEHPQAQRTCNAEYRSALEEARKEVDWAILYLQAQAKKQLLSTKEFGSYHEEETDLFGGGFGAFGTNSGNAKTKGGRRRRRK